ncbi:RagB/SusD family nutrient uptake outer membrane protein [Chitinophaga sp. HK235]|uniref:RagB/SusD family nutrient uptake outer membrane protein n=1 Tax=Chitinophaga sp. HK235 TaxID=2952571 RepID=UPI001BAAE8D1|nr:RagB/SusD family nutrient uptake outer membrane protein [Chitinophaga sp. HK235]
MITNKIPRIFMSYYHKYSTIILLILASTISPSCNKFVEVGLPPNKVTSDATFKDDPNATSAVVGLYSQVMAITNIASGSITAYTGLASDELLYTLDIKNPKEFQSNTISSTNGIISLDLWSRPYQYIYQANACIEGISASTGISSGVKNQLLGECLLLRSFLYFYLIQLYGNVPYINFSDYTRSATLPRTDVSEIYQNIVNDLNKSKKLLTETNPTSGVVRPNKYAARALLARVYLYTGNWALAEEEATAVIESQKYSLVTDLSKVFLMNSNEAIWQIMPTGTIINTQEGNLFVSNSPVAVPTYLISDQLLSAFEPGDPRKTSWISTKVIAGRPYNFPFKYKIPAKPNTVVTEYYNILRLAEQYLIRAESRIRLGKTNAGIEDINTLRKRARGNSSNILSDRAQNLSFDDAMKYLQQERRIELFAEWGQRWFDLKRFKLASLVLKPIKPSWRDSDTLFPIPNSEILLNKNLTQNNGYN